MNHKTLVATAIALSAVLAPLGGWTLLTVSSSSARISVLEEAKGDLKERLTRMEDTMNDKLDRVLEEQRQVRADLRRSQLPPSRSNAPRVHNSP